ncbi:MAG: hypothetical protein NZ929_02765 [Aigarchaeota archaeon]|nr:hypothetical protein [Aigarchaeota archaeon]MCX8192318.1 hypothetical protein [Nitrososphaeria archaeon]MDW7986842.1 hypothetical protein [Nitrososphaerota archaeon]
MVEAKYFVKVVEAGKPLKVSKEASEIVKTAVGGKMIQRMKKEYVDCPVAKRQIPFIECFLCVSFIRRVKGEVHCRGEEFKIRT